MATATRSPKRVTSKARKPAARAARRSTAKAGHKAAGAAKPVTRVAAKPVAKLAGKSVAKFAGKGALMALRALARRALDAGGEAARDLAERLPEAGHRAVEAGLSRRLPIQVSIDVAVPIAVAWDEWMALESLPEGVDRVVQIERDGEVLFGSIAGPGGRDWEAEIVDERPCQSFAWRSVEGSDCAGLVTFHELSPRLTRIELDLDVVPTGPVQAVAFASHLAHRHAQAELRRFKARLEFINPDVYEEAGSSADGDAPPDDEDGGDNNHDS